MKDAKAVSKLNRFSPQKARLVADNIRGKNVLTAFSILAGINNKPKRFIEKTLKSAVANFKNINSGSNDENLYVKEIFIDRGPQLKRFKPRAMGRAYKILKPTSHIRITVADKNEN